MIKNIDDLAKFVKGGADVLQKAIESKEETTIEFIEGSFVSNQELETLKTTVRADGKKEGQTIGYDFAMKDLKKKFGLEIEGKDLEVISEHLNKKIIADAKIEPSKKIEELSTSLSNLQKQYKTDIETKESEVAKLKGSITDIRINSELQTITPDGLAGVKPSQFAALARMEYSFEYDDAGQLIAKKGSNILKDKFEKPLPIKEILTDFANQNGWLGNAGRGSKDSVNGSQKFETINDVYRFMETNRIDPMSAEGEKLLKEFSKIN